MLVLLGAVSAFVAVNVAFGGLETLGLQGPTKYVQVTDHDAYLLRDSHARFYGGVYLGLALFLIVASTDLRRFRTGHLKDQTPYGLLGLKLPELSFWEFLKLTPERLREQQSATAHAP